MKYLSIALGVSLAMGLVIFAVIYTVLQDAHLAEGIAALPLVGSHHLAEMLERKDARRSLSPDRPTLIHTFQGFAIPWYQMAIYGTIVLVAMVFLAGGLAGMISGVVLGEQEPDPSKVIIATAVLSIPAQILGGYFVGRWMATRTSANGLRAVLVSCVAAAIIGRLVDLYLLGDELTKSIYNTAMTPGEFLYLTSITVAIFALGALPGYWRGTNLRLAKYLQYLLGVLPKDTRDTLVNLAFEEVEKVAAHAPPPGAHPHPH